ncbi:MAG: Xaa-Pro peptidase family protein [Desulfobacteraceae bacterium]|jgi:Xaa-Pro aminopeptidase
MIEKRIQRVRELFHSKGIDALMVLVEENRHYLSGFTGEDHQFDESAGALFISKDKLILATDTRFEIQAMDEAPQYEVVIYKKGLAKELPSIINRLKIARLGFESVRVTVKQYDTYRKALETGDHEVALVPVEDMVEGLRLIKSTHEVELTRNALALAEEAFRQVVKTLKPGVTEKSIAWEMERRMRMAGASGLSFPVIVAAGPNSALPHAIPSDRPIRENEPILFDWGAILEHYCSDTSRTVILGKPDDTFLDVFHTVLDAQQKAIDAITAGAGSKTIDAIARVHISTNGYGNNFGHGLGHGTGLAVHEAPRLSPISETTLESGMIVTVEPGIYLPQWGGVRIENQVVVGKNGPTVLNRLSTSYDINKI